MKKFILLVLLGFFLVLPGSEAQNTTALNQKLPMDPAVRTGKLKNGLTYFIRKNTEPKNRAQLQLVVKAGSILESDQQQGLAHFIEHMQFNGTKNFPKTQLVDFLQKSGLKFGADLNAYTSFDETVYQLPVPTDSAALFEKYFLVLSDWANKATFDPVEIDKERGVVLEESRIGKGASSRIREKLLPVIFRGSLYASRLPIGVDSIIAGSPYATIRQFYTDWYRPDLQAVVAVGDFDVDNVERLIKKYFTDIPPAARPKERKQYSVPLSGGTEAVVITDKEQPYHIVQLYYLHPERKEITGTDRRSSIMISLFNSMIGQRLQELLQKADPPYQFGASNYSGFLGNLDALTVFAVAKNGDVEKALKAVLNENERARKFGFTASELERAKTRYLTQVEKQFNEKDKTNSEAYTSELVSGFLNDVVMTDIGFDLDFMKANLPGITLQEVNALVNRMITKDNRVLALIAPEKDKEKLPDTAQLKSWLDDTGTQVEAYVDETISKPLLEQLPPVGGIVSEKTIPEIGVTELVFTNGLKAVLKPTDFKNDEISFRGVSWGGSSLYPDEDYESASMASTLAEISGAGSFTSTQLGKYLTGKRVQVRSYISGISEGMAGTSSVKDLETALQLVYVKFTGGKLDPDAVKGFMVNQRDFIVSAEKTPTPEKVYRDSLQFLLGGGHYRATPMTAARFDKTDPEKALKIYHERFADASGFTFVFVGNFKVDEIKPLLARYLGSLPSSRTKEDFRDLKMNPPSGVVEKIIKKGTEDKAMVSLIFSGPYVPSADEDACIAALGEILSIKLIEKLREEESGVYSPGVFGSGSRVPSPRYQFRISFGCSPANVEKLIRITLEEIGKIRKDGAQQADIDKFRAEEKLDIQEKLKTNDFWLGELTSSYQYHSDPKEILDLENDLKKVTSGTTRATAAKYLSGKDLIRVVLLPEGK